MAVYEHLKKDKRIFFNKKCINGNLFIQKNALIKFTKIFMLDRITNKHGKIIKQTFGQNSPKKLMYKYILGVVRNPNEWKGFYCNGEKNHSIVYNNTVIFDIRLSAYPRKLQISHFDLYTPFNIHTIKNNRIIFTKHILRRFRYRFENEKDGFIADKMLQYLKNTKPGISVRLCNNVFININDKLIVCNYRDDNLTLLTLYPYIEVDMETIKNEIISVLTDNKYAPTENINNIAKADL